jgi:DNA-directed RNA polymerase I subunit RPA1
MQKMLTSNELIRSNFAAKSKAIAYKHRIDLQTYLNWFMDMSKDPPLNNQARGIRQLLERNEGIFRKHLMGKRVNYACRSVISPDPYIGTNEIGILRHFAVNLTYPTPVNDINIEAMRTLVERGPDQYPGADGWSSRTSGGFEQDGRSQTRGSDRSIANVRQERWSTSHNWKADEGWRYGSDESTGM